MKSNKSLNRWEEHSEIHPLSDELQVLSQITPSLVIENELRKIVTNNLFEREAEPYIKFSRSIVYGANDKNESDYERCPQFFLYVLNKEASKFKLVISFYNCEFLSSGQFSIECMKKSRFSSWFKSENWLRYEAILDMDLMTAARFLTYYLNLFGCGDLVDSEIGKKMIISRGDISQLSIPTDISVPVSLSNALEKMMGLNISAYDDVSLELIWEDSSISLNNENLHNAYLDCSMQFNIYYDEDGYTFIMFNEFPAKEMEFRKRYRNFNCFTFGYMGEGYESIRFTVKDTEEGMRLLTDYFLLLYPNVRQDEIVTSFVLSGKEDELKGNSSSPINKFHFYPDGSEDSPELLSAFIDAVCVGRGYVVSKEEDIKNLEITKIEDGNVHRFDNTVYLDHIFDILKKLSLGSKVYIYEGDTLRMFFELRNPGLDEFGNESIFLHIYMNLILKPGQMQAFENVSSINRYSFSDLENGDRMVEMLLGCDLFGAARYVTYYINSLGYNIPSLHFEKVYM